MKAGAPAGFGRGGAILAPAITGGRLDPGAWAATALRMAWSRAGGGAEGARPAPGEPPPNAAPVLAWAVGAGMAAAAMGRACIRLAWDIGASARWTEPPRAKASERTTVAAGALRYWVTLTTVLIVMFSIVVCRTLATLTWRK
jgi:hypothetical protein